MAWPAGVLMLSAGSFTQAFLTIACVFLIYKLVKYFISGEPTGLPPNCDFPVGRRLGYTEESLHLFSTEKGGVGNICVAISLASRQTLSHEHVRDALILLARRQPMLRAVIRTTESKDRYFEVKEITEVINMLDISTSEVKASEWQNVWFQYTAKQRENGLLWRLVILQEELIEETKDYVNTLMFKFSHCSIDGVSCVKFCKQFHSNLNELANGTISADKDITSLTLLPYVHDIVSKGRFWHSLFNFLLVHCGLQSILKFCIEKMFARVLQKKPDNPFYARFPPPANLKLSDCSHPCRLSVKVFNEDETRKIVQACKANKCTVTGALATAAHLAFCQLIKGGIAEDMKLDCQFSINGQRYCVPKPQEDYLGCFVYIFQDFYMKYATAGHTEFWKMAQETTRRIQDFLRKQQYLTEETVMSRGLEPRQLLNLVDNMFISKSSCNFISSFGSFNFGEQHYPETYKLRDCFINNIARAGMICTFLHFNHTINGKMTWHIVSDATLDSSHAEKFANLCFGRFIEIASGGDSQCMNEG